MAWESREKLNFLFQCWKRELAMKLQKLHSADKVVRLRKGCSFETYVCL